MKKLTQQEAIINFLYSQDGWVPGYFLSKVEICNTWIGSSGERSARRLASNDCHEKLKRKVKREMGRILKTQGIKTDVFGRPVDNKYVYYCSIENEI